MTHDSILSNIDQLPGELQEDGTTLLDTSKLIALLHEDGSSQPILLSEESVSLIESIIDWGTELFIFEDDFDCFKEDLGVDWKEILGIEISFDEE